MRNELDQEKANLIKISNEKQRLEEHLHLLNDKTSIIRKNSEPKKDDNLKKEKVILEALSTKVSFLEVILIILFINLSFKKQENFKILSALKQKDTRNQELEGILTQKTVVIDLFLTEIQNKMPVTVEYNEK